MLACRRAVTFAIEVGIQDITFEGDSLTMIRAINSGGASEAPYGNLIEDILVYVSSFSSVVFKHVKRPCNKVADALAKKAKFGDVFQAWMEVLPPDITPSGCARRSLVFPFCICFSVFLINPQTLGLVSQKKKKNIFTIILFHNRS